MVTYTLIDGHRTDISKILDSAENLAKLNWGLCVNRTIWSVWAVIQNTTRDPGYAQVVARINLTRYKNRGVWAVNEVQKELLEREAYHDDWEFELSLWDGPIIVIGDSWEDSDA